MPKRQLKIGFVLDTSLDPNDGVQQYVLRLGEWLSSAGHEIHYLVGETTERQLPNIHSLSRNVSVKFNGNRTTIPLWANSTKVKKLLRQLDLDVLHVQMPYHPLMAQKIILAASKKTAVIGTFHILPVTKMESFATKALGWTLKPSLKRFDEILAVSEPAKKFVNKSFGTEASVLPNVVDLAWFQNSTPKHPVSDDKIQIVFLGRLVERKGGRQLLQAVAALPESCQKAVHVTIGGKGPLMDELTAYAKQASIHDIVTFAGFVAEPHKPEFLASADIAVFPATGGESFGIVLLEAMAARSGVVLGGNNPGYANVIGHWPEALFDPDNTAEFSRKLQTFIESSAKRRKLHVAQQRYIRAFDIKTVGPKLVGVYENAIAKRARKLDNTK